MTTSEDFDPRWIGAIIPKEHWHFHAKLYQRYGIVLPPGEFSKILKSIRDGSAQLIQRRSNGEAIYSHRVNRLGERFYVLAKGNRIITAWPPNRGLNEIRREP